MSVVWGTYVPFDPGVDRPLHEVSRREARAAFDRLMDAKADRIEELRRLLDDNGVHLSADNAGLQSLNDWFRNEVEGHTESGRLLPRWYSVVNDVALFIGDVIIDRCLGVSWVMFDHGKRDAAYQRHVLMGFGGVPNPKYNVDVDLLVATYAHRVIAGQPVEADAFVVWVGAATTKA